MQWAIGLVEREPPGFADVLWRLGNVRWTEGNTAEAMDLWRRTIAAEPSHARAMPDLGIAYEIAGDDARRVCGSVPQRILRSLLCGSGSAIFTSAMAIWRGPAKHGPTSWNRKTAGSPLPG